MSKQFGQAYTNCQRVARMYGFDFTFHYRPDGRVDTLSGWIGKKCSTCQFFDEHDATQGMYNIMKSAAWETIRVVEVDKMRADILKNGWDAQAT